jgi:hypothetical protein
MVEDRSSTEDRAPAGGEFGAGPKDALAALARHGANLQIAALVAGGQAARGWAQATDRLAQAVGHEFLRRIDGETNSSELIVGVAAATNTHLHELAALPSTAVDGFDRRRSVA